MAHIAAIGCKASNLECYVLTVLRMVLGLGFKV